MLDPGSSSLSHMIRFGTVSWVAVSSRYAVVLPDSDWQSFRTGFLLTTIYGSLEQNARKHCGARLLRIREKILSLEI